MVVAAALTEPLSGVFHQSLDGRFIDASARCDGVERLIDAVGLTDFLDVILVGHRGFEHHGCWKRPNADVSEDLHLGGVLALRHDVRVEVVASKPGIEVLTDRRVRCREQQVGIVQ